MNIAFLGMAAALGLSAAGSAFGTGFAGMSSVGAWKKCYASGKQAPFIMIAFAGAPLTQTIYGFLLMNFIKSANCDPSLGWRIWWTGNRYVRSVPGQMRRCSCRCTGCNRKGYCKLLHRYRCYRDRSPLHTGIQFVAVGLIGRNED